MPHTSINHWPATKCARAFWGQQELLPYQKLLADTTAWLESRPGQRWLDLGCGCGKLTEALWHKSGGSVKAIVGLDCAAANALAFDRLASVLDPLPAEGQLQFAVHDFSAGFANWPDHSFDGVVSGLAIQYAEHFDEQAGCWTRTAYDRALAEVHRLLVPGGEFVFSVNVPEPSWGKVGWGTLSDLMAGWRRHRYLKRAWRMWRYGRWLTREARRGRFHYLPIAEIERRLSATGFVEIEYRLSYAGQAYLIRCKKS